MSLPLSLEDRLKLPAFAAPMFIISNPDLAIAQCQGGMVGSFPSLNARGEGELDEWLARMNETVTEQDAPYAVNLIVHRSNAKLEEHLELCVKYKVPIVITSLGARPEVNEAVQGYGGIVFHDVTTNEYARKAIDKGADGLVAVAAGAGGHAGTRSPFALVQEVRDWFDGPLALSGSIATGRGILAAEAMGADVAYIGSAFIATEEANAVDAYKKMITESTSDDIVYSNLFTGVHGNYLAPSIRAAGLDPDNLESSDPSKMDFAAMAENKSAKAWKDIWGCGQGIGAITEVVPAAELIARWKTEYAVARDHLLR